MQTGRKKSAEEIEGKDKEENIKVEDRKRGKSEVAGENVRIWRLEVRRYRGKEENKGRKGNKEEGNKEEKEEKQEKL